MFQRSHTRLTLGAIACLSVMACTVSMASAASPSQYTTPIEEVPDDIFSKTYSDTRIVDPNAGQLNKKLSPYNRNMHLFHSDNYDLSNPALTPAQRDANLQAYVTEKMQRMNITSPSYLRAGFLNKANARVQADIVSLAEHAGTAGSNSYEGSVEQMFDLTGMDVEDWEWFRGWDYNVSVVYANALEGGVNWIEYATDRFDGFYEDVKYNLTIFTEQVDYMLQEYDVNLALHKAAGTKEGLLAEYRKRHGIKVDDGGGTTEEYVSVVNIMNFIFNIINLVGLIVFLAFKRRVGPSAVLDTEMTFPSSPTAQI